MLSVTVSLISVPDLALPAWLAGTWSVERDIDGGRGAFTGTADFSPEPDGTLRWSEVGRLQMDGYEGAATRVLVLHPGAPWQVRFDDGRLFHELDLARGLCAVEHLCGPDVYRGIYTVAGDAEFVVRWAVAGPGRDDTIVSRYQRTAG
jgi:hypothetical protein